MNAHRNYAREAFISAGEDYLEALGGSDRKMEFIRDCLILAEKAGQQEIDELQSIQNGIIAGLADIRRKEIMKTVGVYARAVFLLALVEGALIAWCAAFLKIFII